MIGSNTTLHTGTAKASDRPGWIVAKNIGTAGEMLVAKMLRELGFTVARSPDDVAAAHDLVVNATVEIKTDAKAEISGRIAVEVSHRGLPSGIVTSEASAWCFVVGAVCYMLPTERLRHLITTRYFPRVPAGERAEVLLVPIAAIRAISRVIPIGGTR